MISETQLSDLSVRPHHELDVNGARIGYVELEKQPRHTGELELCQQHDLRQ